MENDDAELNMLYSCAVHKTLLKVSDDERAIESANTHEALM